MIFFLIIASCKKEKSESKEKDSRGANPMSISVPNLTCTANTAPLEQGNNLTLVKAFIFIEKKIY